MGRSLDAGARQPGRRAEARLRHHPGRGGAGGRADGPGHAVRRHRPAGRARPDRGTATGGPAQALPDHPGRGGRACGRRCQDAGGGGSRAEPTGARPGGDGMTAPDSLLVRAVLCLYPRPWRDRYQDEFARLLVDLLACAPRRARIRLIVNAAIGAADARLNLSGGNMADRIRSSLGVVVCALVVFAIAGSGFQKMTEYPDFTAAASQHSSIGTSFNVLRAAAVAAGIIVLAAAIPLVWTILRQAVA